MKKDLLLGIIGKTSEGKTCFNFPPSCKHGTCSKRAEVFLLLTTQFMFASMDSLVFAKSRQSLSFTGAGLHNNKKDSKFFFNWPILMILSTGYLH